jgi:predicted outer membrane repeat protein
MLTDRGFNLTLSRTAMTRGSNKNPHGASGAVLAKAGSHLTIARSAFRDDYGTVGGAISNLDGGLTVAGSTFSENVADGAGGAIYNDGTATTFTGSRFRANTATESGGAVAAISPVNLVRDLMSQNHADDRGGACS